MSIDTRRADASRAAAPLECAELDLDQAEHEHAQHVKRGVRTLIARAKRLERTSDRAAMEGLRVELLSYRDANRTWLNDAEVHQLQRAAYRVELLKRTTSDDGRVDHAAAIALAEPAGPDPLEALAMFGTSTEDRPDAASCQRCGQAFIPHSGSTRCASCDAADADQGDQLGMFEIAPTVPTPKARAPRAPQPEGLF